MEAIESLMASLCPQVPDVKSLISIWTKQRMGRYIGIMKIGFPVSSDPASPTSMDPISARGEDVEMVSLSRDGALIEHNTDKSTVKEAIRMDEITGVTLAENVSDGSEQTVFNATSFTIHVQGKRYGPFTPPTDLELQSWYLVISTFAQQNRLKASKLDMPSQRRMFENCATMALGELARDPGLDFYEAYQIALRSISQVVKDFDLSRIISNIQI